MYRRISAAVDGSPTSNKAVTAALEMAIYSGVKSIHVLDDMTYRKGHDSYSAQSYSVINLMQKTGEKIPADPQVIVESAGVQADTQLVDSIGAHLAETVALEAKKWDATILVVGPHGRRGIGRMLMCSDGERIIRMAPCLVLVVRSAKGA